MQPKLVMAIRGYLLLFLLAFLGFAAAAKDNVTSMISRGSFPSGFVFGTASSAYQYEGAANEGGRGPSIWDTFTHKHPEKITGRGNGDIAIDEYHRYKEDVGIMKDMGLDAYRFSISWSRILPNGKLSGGVNKEGIRYYNKLINELLANGIQPYVTVFHWDVPQALEDEYGGFLSPKIVDNFRDYSDICFREFGDRVEHWITVNEPWTFSNGGYADGTLAPGRCSHWQKLNCTGGDSGTEPYLVTHHLLLSHAAAVNLYRQKYQKYQKGIIGITLISSWMVPLSEEKQHKEAAERALDFMFGWYMDPITNGYYPKSMQSLVGKRLPKFSKEESEMIKGSFDFLGLNYYTAYYYASNTHMRKKGRPSYLTDSQANTTAERHGIPIGPQAGSSWLYVYPRGIKDLLLYTKRKYNNPIIYITENGVDEVNNDTLPLKEALNDSKRIDYHQRHLSFVQSAIQDGANVKGYFAWSFLDDFEWGDGYSVRFGINYVDYKDGLKRHPKLSAHWFKKILKR